MPTYAFRWIRWNVDHIAEHGIAPAEAEHVVRHAGRGFPRHGRNGSKVVHGQTASGDYLQIVYTIDDSPADTVFIFHARPLTAREKSRLVSKTKRRGI